MSSSSLSPSSQNDHHAEATTKKPKPPLQYYSSERSSSEGVEQNLGLDDVASYVVQMEEKRQRAYDLSRQMQVSLTKLKHATESSCTLNIEDDEAIQAQLQELTALVRQVSCNTTTTAPSTTTSTTTAGQDRAPRLANLSFRMEEYARCLAYHHFLRTGRLIPPSSFRMSSDTGAIAPDDAANATTTGRVATTIVTDEEYLAGACMGLAQDLQSYGLGRATVRDRESVRTATDLVSDIHEYLLGLDFRNGPLRRKYDGTKYALKGLETILYELAVTGCSSASNDENDENDEDKDGRQSKKQKRESFALIPIDELKELQARMVRRDELRESLIKKCRDGQKAAKQSIFALHRGDADRARQLLQQCHASIVTQLLPIAQEEPPLRIGGSLMGVMEEYVEAKLFATWLYGPEFSNPDHKILDTNCRPSGMILKVDDFHDVSIEIEEYVGGLCDLTGEIGRYAVQRGTARDEEGVKVCLRTNSDILYAFQRMERLPGGTGKKMDALDRSVEKLKRMLYEMSLSEAAGGRDVRTEVDDRPPTATSNTNNRMDIDNDKD